MSDAELTALAAVAQAEAAAMQADNNRRALSGEFPMWGTDGYGYPPATTKLIEELYKRKLLE